MTTNVVIQHSEEGVLVRRKDLSRKTVISTRGKSLAENIFLPWSKPET